MSFRRISENAKDFREFTDFKDLWILNSVEAGGVLR
jgi:hypothetical protein